MNKFAKIPLMVLGGAGGTFAVLFTVYFFNLDMKFMAYCVDPILQKVYNSRTPNYYV
ncbi:MAG: hypothetical protein HUJ66_07940 [Oscillospiraceae bacterium]|nr:hypothetical protein [Oscillospiraceae bacterium]